VKEWSCVRTGNRIIAALAAIVLLAAAAAQAQTFPSKTVRIIVPFAPGGAADIMARLVAEQMSPSLGQPVIVENRPGAGAVVGYELTARAAPDGYTMVSVWPSFVINPSIRKVNYDPVKDFEALGQTIYLPMALSIQTAMSPNSLRELVAYARANPGKLQYGTPGTGTIQHVVGEIFRVTEKIDITHVPYQGGGAQVTAVAGGHLPMAVANVTETTAQAKGGKIKVLAVTSDERTEALPEAPTAREAGFPELAATNWSGMMVPRGTPKAAIARLNAEMNRALSKPEVREKLKTNGMFIAPGTPEAFEKLVQAEALRYARVVKEAGIKAD
jgi:tripartite-type tricarboxylate transporter receptor subunit TctC